MSAQIGRYHLPGMRPVCQKRIWKGESMHVSWTVKQNLSGSYDVFKNGNIVQRRIPFEKLEATMNPYNVRGTYWQNLLRQLEDGREGTVGVDS